MAEKALLPVNGSDEQLLSRAHEDPAAGGAAFSLLMARYTPLVQSLAAQYSKADRDDLAQEGFLGLLAAMQTFQPQKAACFRTYATVCIRNRMISLLRRQHTQPACVQDPDDAAEVTLPDPASQLIDRESAAALHTKLRSVLSALEYKVLMLHLSSYSYEEIAQRLQIPVKAVDNAWQRVRRKCLSLLAPSA